MKKAQRTISALMVLVWRHYHGRRPAVETPRQEKIRHFRMLALGLIIMLIGVNVAEYSAECSHRIKIAGDMFGYLIHALGAIPFLKFMAEAVKFEL